MSQNLQKLSHFLQILHYCDQFLAIIKKVHFLKSIEKESSCTALLLIPDLPLAQPVLVPNMS